MLYPCTNPQCPDKRRNPNNRHRTPQCPYQKDVTHGAPATIPPPTPPTRPSTNLGNLSVEELFQEALVSEEGHEAYRYINPHGLNDSLIQVTQDNARASRNGEPHVVDPVDLQEFWGELNYARALGSPMHLTADEQARIDDLCERHGITEQELADEVEEEFGGILGILHPNAPMTEDTSRLFVRLPDDYLEELAENAVYEKTGEMPSW